MAPRSHDSWVERHTMRNGRIRFWRRIHAAGGNRVRLLYPAVEQGGHATDTMIHSKVMVVDDRFLRVGSANMNNRSMGADTECDLAIEARSGSRAHGHPARSATACWASIAAWRPPTSRRSLARHGSLVRAA